MSPTTILFMICALIAGMLSSGQTSTLPESTRGAREPALAASAPFPDSPLWTTWGASQYALADDGASLWIGGSGSIVRWDKQQGWYRRYSAVDGLPHTVVLAAAVDGAGNRWFGGDGGLSRLDAEERWTHFRAADSGLYSDLVDAIAVAGGDTLYLSHGLPGGSVSRRDGDGAWRWFPNRETAIQADYAAIVQTRASNPLWTVAGNEIWAGSRVFDGERWYERKLPSQPGEPIALAADSRGHVWALSTDWIVYEWDGAGWLAHPVYIRFTGKITALAVDNDDRVWIGLQERGGIPYTNETAEVRDLLGTKGSSFAVPGPVAALLPTPEGLWGVGPGWLMSPDLTVSVLTDGPRFQDLPDASLGSDGSIWLYSGFQQPYTVGAVQTLDDRGTLSLEDDVWPVRPADYQPYLGYCERVTAFERAAGDTWYASYCDPRFPMGSKAVRYRGRERIEYPLPLAMEQQVSDIFAQDARHIWFASRGYGDGYVLGLDDGGTPADTSDDSWQTLPIEPMAGEPVVAVDALGRLWHGQGSGLYRYDGSSWRLVYGERPVCDLAPAADGTLYAQIATDQATGCEEHWDRILVVRADGTIEDTLFYSKWLILGEPATVRTAWRRNSLWAIASDGAIWYVSHLDPGQELQRRTSSGLTTYALPVAASAVQRLEVDARGHVWLVAESQLWRMEGPRPTTLYLPIAAK